MPPALGRSVSGDPQGRGDEPWATIRASWSPPWIYPPPSFLYRDLYSARGQDENFIKMVKNDLASDRTSDHDFLANHMRLFFSCAAYVLHQALRTEVLVHTELAKAQPFTVILKLFKLAVRVVAVQGPRQTAVADVLSGQRPPAPSHRPPVPDATAAAAPRLTPAVNTHSGHPRPVGAGSVLPVWRHRARLTRCDARLIPATPASVNDPPTGNPSNMPVSP